MKLQYIVALMTAVSAFAVNADKLAPFPDWGKPYAVTSGPHEHLLASYYGINS
jgi:hypothetical protein